MGRTERLAARKPRISILSKAARGVKQLHRRHLPGVLGAGRDLGKDRQALQDAGERLLLPRRHDDPEHGPSGTLRRAGPLGGRLYPGGPESAVFARPGQAAVPAITLVLDNARYQKCKLVGALAESLQIELLYLPSYSPNLNLTERLWKFVKKTGPVLEVLRRLRLIYRGHHGLPGPDASRPQDHARFPADATLSDARRTSEGGRVTYTSACTGFGSRRR
jgi:hypothetical protein